MADGIGELQIRGKPLHDCLRFAVIIAKGQQRNDDVAARRVAVPRARPG
jgi:hypothetical protein